MSLTKFTKKIKSCVNTDLNYRLWGFFEHKISDNFTARWETLQVTSVRVDTEENFFKRRYLNILYRIH